MKKITALLSAMMILFLLCGCGQSFVKDDKSHNNGTEQSAQQGKPASSDDKGYTISVPKDLYKYEKDFDNGVLEETWEKISNDDAKIKVMTYKDTNIIAAQTSFIKDCDDYVFENTGTYPLHGTDDDGDTVLFDMYESGSTIYIVAREYEKSADEGTKSELEKIASSFKLEQ